MKGDIKVKLEAAFGAGVDIHAAVGGAIAKGESHGDHTRLSMLAQADFSFISFEQPTSASRRTADATSNRLGRLPPSSPPSSFPRTSLSRTLWTISPFPLLHPLIPSHPKPPFGTTKPHSLSGLRYPPHSLNLSLASVLPTYVKTGLFLLGFKASAWTFLLSLSQIDRESGRWRCVRRVRR